MLVNQPLAKEAGVWAWVEGLKPAFTVKTVTKKQSKTDARES